MLEKILAWGPILVKGTFMFLQILGFKWQSKAILAVKYATMNCLN